MAEFGRGYRNKAGYSLYPSLAVDNEGVLTIAWQDNSGGNYEIYAKQSLIGTTPIDSITYNLTRGTNFINIPFASPVYTSESFLEELNMSSAQPFSLMQDRKSVV